MVMRFSSLGLGRSSVALVSMLGLPRVDDFVHLVTYNVLFFFTKYPKYGKYVQFEIKIGSSQLLSKFMIER